MLFPRQEADEGDNTGDYCRLFLRFQTSHPSQPVKKSHILYLNPEKEKAEKEATGEMDRRVEYRCFFFSGMINWRRECKGLAEGSANTLGTFCFHQ